MTLGDWIQLVSAVVSAVAAGAAWRAATQAKLSARATQAGVDATRATADATREAAAVAERQLNVATEQADISQAQVERELDLVARQVEVGSRQADLSLRALQVGVRPLLGGTPLQAPTAKASSWHNPGVVFVQSGDADGSQPLVARVTLRNIGTGPALVQQVRFAHGSHVALGEASTAVVPVGETVTLQLQLAGGNPGRLAFRSQLVARAPFCVRVDYTDANGEQRTASFVEVTFPSTEAPPRLGLLRFFTVNGAGVVATTPFATANGQPST